MNRKYTPVADGEWVQPRSEDYGLACCDCGLIHRMNFRVVAGRVQFQAFRDRAATSRRRRRLGLKVKKNAD